MQRHFVASLHAARPLLPRALLCFALSHLMINDTMNF